MNMKHVYIAHPLGGNDRRERNRRIAQRWVVWAAESGVVPYATWTILAMAWDESRREQGLQIDFAQISRCDELWLVGGRVSPGMSLERDHALNIGVKVVDMTMLGEFPPVFTLPKAAVEDFGTWIARHKPLVEREIKTEPKNEVPEP